MPHLFIPGHPAPQGSKRHIGNGRLIESSKALGPWRKHITQTARQHLTPNPGPAHVELTFVMPRRKREPKRTTEPHTRRPDLDKLARAVLDALTGVAFHDDSQVTGLVAIKRTAEPHEEPGVHISVNASSRPVVVGRLSA